MQKKLFEIAESIGGTVVGDKQHAISSVGTIQNANRDQITFLANSRYKGLLNDTLAGAVLARKQDVHDYTGNVVFVDDPYLAYAKVAALLHPTIKKPAGIHPTAVIDESANIGKNCHIGAFCVIGANVTIKDCVEIGPNCTIEDDVSIEAGTRLVANITIYHHVKIGARVLVHAGVVIGSDGFGLANDSGKWLKVPQVGSVRIGNDAEIGANTTIDRGAIEDTVLEDGVKLDNQIQIAHNVHVGAHTAIAACTGVAGSAKIGKHCAIGGGVGILGHLEIVDGVTVTAMSLVTKSIPVPGVYSSGTPLEENHRWHRNFVRYKQLDEMARRLKSLENKLL